MSGIASADIDGDNDLDIVVCGYENTFYTGFINIRYNDGNGQFSTFQTFLTEKMEMGVELADLNDDGYPDIAAANVDYISVYLNNQDGTFPTQVNYAQVYLPQFRDISTADMDSDGDLDLLTYSLSDQQIAILLNAGDGTFPEVHYYAGGDRANAFAIARLDSGSTMDVAVTSSVPNRDFVYLFLNTGLNLPTDLAEKHNLVPNQFLLEQNYPNPFNPKTMISYQLPVTSQVDLSIYNILGQKIATLVSEKQPAGTYKINWNANGFSSGMYFYHLKTNTRSEVGKMMLIR
ncbi:MAG: T9SS type A sorting domain-containing protein [Calditrichales bacterium]|nr:MAG: T9SS type A sorting domain-containing protein [Calditrichales bacterium]